MTDNRESERESAKAAAQSDDQSIVVINRWLRIAALRDEELIEGDLAASPLALLAEVRQSGIRADVLTFPQSIHDLVARHDLPHEMDNAAVAATSSFQKWWEALPQETRKNVRRAEKRGLVVRKVRMNQEFIQGIKAIYDETPIRQGKHFWHYGKSLVQIEKENGTYLNRSEFIGAYLNDALVGFMKWVYVGKRAQILQILSRESCQDARPMNAMIAEAVKICEALGIDSLVYANYTYGNNENSPLAEFKRRNGFSKVEFPRYFVPLNFKGRIGLKLRLHHGLLGILPPRIIQLTLTSRARILRWLAGIRARK
jgi:hypothetical protein